jgi:very-short-patch-repair endonuclease
VLRRSEELAGTLSDIDAAAASDHWRDRSRSVLEYAERARALLGRRDDLVPWQHFLRSQAWLHEAGLKKLGEFGEKGKILPADIVPAFRFVFYSSLARGMCYDLPDVEALGGVGQEQLRQQFGDADRKAIELYRSYAADLIGRRSIPTGNGTGPVRTWTELSLINQELSKQKRHRPIRELVRRAGLALQAMKPCFMMGPLSVAQYLAPGHLRFDLVVMDEASQLKPEDALGAIARGTQVVVVGDPKQLPPSSFFDRVVREESAEEDDDTTGAEEAESILDVATTRYQPVRRLRWHYRSRHHSLIAYSNREFYDGDLMVFPSASERHPELGVSYRHVARGCFEHRRNPNEATEVVSAVLDHMRTKAQESLGVVALNFDQRELIEEMLDRQLRDDPVAMAYQERMEQRGEPFFVKNLENVQGDERDVIFISGTYGPDSSGAQHQRFGPITGANGHRRLNVLFTRAKDRVVVFSSLDPDRIRTQGASRGIKALKEYLTYAKTGVLPESDADGGGPTNDFERSVGDILRSRGYEVAYQVGVAGFFIDIAVRNPAKPGVSILGIECDGATFHSSRSARDRDRLRQEILERRGWKIHRVWSTDWYKARSKEISRLLDRVERVLGDDPDYRQYRERKVRRDSLLTRLTELRDEVRQAFPDSPGSQCLLREELLALFVEKRPTTREDWFRIVPYELRAATEAGQVGRFLGRVLGIIKELGD